MAEIVESLSRGNALDISNQKVDLDDGTGGFKMSAEVTFSSGVGTFMLGSGSTGYTCYGTFSAQGAPDTKLTFSENDGILRIGPDVKLEGNLGVLVFNMDSILSQKGILSMLFVNQDHEKQDTIAAFNTPQTPDQTLLDMPDFQGVGWGGWSGPV